MILIYQFCLRLNLRCCAATSNGPGSSCEFGGGLQGLAQSSIQQPCDPTAFINGLFCTQFNQQVAKQRADEETTKAEAKSAADIKKAEEKNRLIEEVKAKQSDLAKNYPDLNPSEISLTRRDLKKFGEKYTDSQKLFLAIPRPINLLAVSHKWLFCIFWRC